MSASTQPVFGVGDASFQAAGGVEGLQRLVDDFYRIMEESGEAATIRGMHPQDLAPARDKLTRFLCGWLGGPKLYAEKYGSIVIPQFHARWPIGAADSEAWLLCMEKAIARQPYSADFAHYLLKQLRVPAERIVQVCQHAHRHPGD